MKTVLSTAALALSGALAAPVSPTATLGDGSTISGGTNSGVDYFRGIPFADSPVGSLRFRPPQPYSGASLNGFAATTHGPMCIMENPLDLSFTDLPEQVVDFLDNTPLLSGIAPGLTFSEDCLFLDVYRPSGTAAGANLPVLFWIFGGGFQFFGATFFDPTLLIEHAISIGQPVVVVVINYRLGVYGWLGGSEVLAQGGPANWGLLDQRLALEWVADNINGFGGNSDKVTIWGESSGAISVAHQMLLYDGNITYKGKDLFQGAIMQSGAVVPTKKMDSPYAQFIFDAVSTAAGCNGTSDPLECLRSAPVDTVTDAMNTVPGIFSSKSIGLSFLPRWDGVALTDQVYNLVDQGKYARVPFIIGDVQDEGTLFGLLMYNYTTTAELEGWVEALLTDVTAEEISTLTQLYPDNPSDGSPFNTGIFNQLYPESKRVNAILGDFVFQWPRRFFLNSITDVPNWSYLMDALYGMPLLGTFHITDVVYQWYLPNALPTTTALRNYWISFAYNQDPSTSSGLLSWPQYSNGQNNMVLSSWGEHTEADNYREAASTYINQNIADLLF